MEDRQNNCDESDEEADEEVCDHNKGHLNFYSGSKNIGLCGRQYHQI